MVQADLALYRAKDDGRNCYRFHNSDLDRQVHTRVLLARELELAIERGELELLYQPQVHIGSGRVVGLEAHVRWNHPSRGTIKPSTFHSHRRAHRHDCRRLRMGVRGGVPPAARNGSTTASPRRCSPWSCPADA